MICLMVLRASKVEGVSLDEPSVRVHVTERTIRLRVLVSAFRSALRPTPYL